MTDLVDPTAPPRARTRLLGPDGRVPRVSTVVSDVAPGPLPTVECHGLTVHVDGVPTVQLASWLATRPQDWAPAARELLRSAHEPQRHRERS